jgi:hypothetical protein
MLERFKQLSLEPIENIRGDQVTADVYRYHPINWGATNIPIKREGLKIGEYAKNPEEFPVDQIMLSRARVGLWGSLTRTGFLI